MKVYLDDERQTPEGWVRCYWPNEVIEKLETKQVTHMSLDHDLGDDSRGTGYDVLLWLEEKVMNERDFPVPHISIHSKNESAKWKMKAAARSILKMKEGTP